MSTSYYAYAIAGVRGGIKVHGEKRDIQNTDINKQPLFLADGRPATYKGWCSCVEFNGILFAEDAPTYFELTEWHGRPVVQDRLDDYLEERGLVVVESGCEGHHGESVVGVELAEDYGINGKTLSIEQIQDGLAKAKPLLEAVGLHEDPQLWIICHISY